MRNMQLLSVTAVALMMLLSLGCNSQARTDCKNNRWRMFKEWRNVKWAECGTAPEMHTMVYTKEERRNNHTYARNIRKRQLREDWTRFWMVDRPTTLSQYPVPAR